MAIHLLIAGALAFHAPLASRRAAAPMMSAVDVDKVYRRAEFWEDETATLLDIVNVLGRWEQANEWSVHAYHPSLWGNWASELPSSLLYGLARPLLSCGALVRFA